MNRKEKKQIYERLHVEKLNHDHLATLGNNSLHKYKEGWVEALEWVLTLGRRTSK